MRSRKNLLALSLFFSVLFYSSVIYVISSFKESPIVASDHKKALIKLVTKFHLTTFDRLEVSQTLLEDYYSKKRDSTHLENGMVANDVIGLHRKAPLNSESLTRRGYHPNQLPEELFGHTEQPQLFICEASRQKIVFAFAYDLKVGKGRPVTHLAFHLVPPKILQKMRDTFGIEWSVYALDKKSIPQLLFSSFGTENLDWLTSAVRRKSLHYYPDVFVASHTPLLEFEMLNSKGESVLVIPMIVNLSPQLRQIIYYTVPTRYLNDDQKSSAWFLLAIFAILSLGITLVSYFFSYPPNKK